MDLGALLLLFALLVGVGLFLAAPLLRGGAPRVLEDSPEVSHLLAERDRVVNALQELDFDFKLGKVPADSYPEQRSGLLQRGVEILRRLDELAPDSSPASEPAAQAAQRIERAAADPGAGLADDRIESMLAARRASRRSKSAGFCPRCGKPVLVSDRFCPNCGKSLQ